MARIMGHNSEQIDVVQRLAAGLGATVEFVDVFIPLIYKAADRYGVDATIATAQSYYETGGGKYNGTVPRSFNNLAGIKVHPEEQALMPGGVAAGDARWAHQRFATPWQGALGHIQHLRAYTGKEVPEDEVVHPRYFYVFGRNTRTLDWEGITWAGATYPAAVLKLARKLMEIGQ